MLNICGLIITARIFCEIIFGLVNFKVPITCFEKSIFFRHIILEKKWVTLVAVFIDVLFMGPV